MNREKKAAIDAIVCYLENCPSNCRVEVFDQDSDEHLQTFKTKANALPKWKDQVLVDILYVLDCENRRMTTTEILAAMERYNFDHSESAIKTKLSTMVDDDYLDNDSKAKPRGYGILEKGLALLQEACR